jgi:HEAT repeat protein
MPLIRKSPAETRPPRPTAAEAIAALATGSASERWTAARGLGASADEIGALGAALAGETDTRVREAIFTALVRVSSSESVAVVLPHLRSDDANLRTGALDALRAMPSAAQPQLGALLEDHDPDVRLLACEIVRELTSADATSLLCALLDRETVPNVCASAIEVLAETGSPEALPALARCAERFVHEPFLIFSLRVAAERIRAQSDASRD